MKTLFFILLISSSFTSLSQEIPDSSKVLFNLLNQTIDQGLGTSNDFQNRGTIYSSIQEYDKAILDYSKAILINTSEKAVYMCYVSRGNALQKQKDFQGSQGDFQSAIKLDKSNPIAYNDLGYHQLLKKEYNKAEKNLLQAIQLDENHTKAYVNLSLVYIELEKQEKAISIINDLIQITKEDPRSYISRADTYVLLGMYKEALADWNTAVEISGNDSGFIGERSKFKDDVINDDHGAVQDAKMVIAKDPNNASSYYLLARPLYDLQDYSSVIENCDLALAINSKYVEALVMKANVLDMYGGKEEAMKLYEQALEINPKDFDIYAQMAIAHYANGNIKKSISTLEKYKLNKIIDPEVYVKLAAYFFETGQFKKAKKDVTTYLEVGNDPGQAHFFLGMINDTLGDRKTGCDHFMKSYETGNMGAVPYLVHNCPGKLDPNFVKQVKLGSEIMELEQERRFLEAIEKVTELIKIAPDSANYYYNRGKQYRYLEMHKEAIKDYQTAISIDNSQGSYWVALAISQLYSNQKEASIETYKKAIIHAPNFPMSYVNLGGSYLEMKEPNKAIPLLETAILLDPQYAKAYAWLGLSYIGIKDYDKACPNLRMAEKLGYNADFGKRVQFCKGR